MEPMKLFSFIILISLSVASSSCRKDPYVPDYAHAGGFVIGKEICSATTPSNDYWLVDLSVDYTSSNTFGDTLTYNGVFYEHVIKTKELSENFKIVGKKLSFDCQFSTSKVSTTSCSITIPVTYALKEMHIINSGEIR